MPAYSLRQLEYFVACVDHGSVARAAESLNVSQPTISVAVAKLEAIFGLQLLMRHPAQGVSVTPDGTRIVQSARALLAQAEEVQQLATATRTEVAGALRIGSFSALAPSVLPGILSALLQEHPGIEPQITEGSQEYLAAALLEGRLDQALIYDIDLPSGLSCRPLSDRHPYVALPADHPLTRQQDVALADLAPLPMILLDLVPSRSYFLGLFADAGLTPQIAHSSPSLELVRGMVGQGLGFSILATRPQGDTTHDGRRLAIRPLRDRTQPSRIVLARAKALRPSRVMRCFETVAVSQLETKPGQPD